MAINSLKVLRVASEMNSMTSEELTTLCDCLNDSIADKMSNYLFFVLQDKDLLNIEVQEPAC